MRQRPLRNLASISALVASCCTGCGGGPASGPLPPPKTTASSPGPATSTAAPSAGPAARSALAPYAVSTETPLVADVIRIFNAAREQGGRPALRVSPELQQVARAQVQAQVDAQPGLALNRGRVEKRTKTEAMPVAARAAKLGHRFRDLKEITVPADGPVAKVLADSLRDPNNEFHKIGFGDWTDFAVAEGRDAKSLPHLSVIFGTAESGRGEGKGTAGDSKK